MFVDASAIISILSNESDAVALAERLGRASTVRVSAVVLYEATTGLARKRVWSIEEAEGLVEEFLSETDAEVIDIDGAIASAALRAFKEFGKGRHPAGLNMGDCFAYACAVSANVPLLFKGDDFGLTDIQVA